MSAQSLGNLTTVAVYNPLDWIDGIYFPYVAMPNMDIIYDISIYVVPLPPISSNLAAGVRSPLQIPQYFGTQVHHLVTLPDDWSIAAVSAGKRWPIIAVYTGNYAPSLGSQGL